MLQEKDNYNIWCIRLAIFVWILLFLIWTGFIIIFIFILVFAFWNKKINIDLDKVLKSIWLYDCIKKYFPDFYKYIYKNKNKTDNIINNHLEKINESIKKRPKDLKRKEKDIKKRKEKYVEKTKKENFKEKKEYLEKSKDKNRFSRGTFNSLKNKSNSFNNSKVKTTSFNNWKSIWDDYESVVDIMNKRK